MIPLVLLPGLLNDADLWRDQIAALTDIAQCQVANITRGETLDQLARSVLAEAPSAFALAGFSLGEIGRTGDPSPRSGARHAARAPRHLHPGQLAGSRSHAARP